MFATISDRHLLGQYVVALKDAGTVLRKVCVACACCGCAWYLCVGVECACVWTRLDSCVLASSVLLWVYLVPFSGCIVCMRLGGWLEELWVHFVSAMAAGSDHTCLTTSPPLQACTSDIVVSRGMKVLEPDNQSPVAGLHFRHCGAKRNESIGGGI